MSDATLMVKAMNSTNAGYFTFRDLWIADLGGISLSDEATETQYVYCDATFTYEDFIFTPVLA